MYVYEESEQDSVHISKKKRFNLDTDVFVERC